MMIVFNQSDISYHEDVAGDYTSTRIVIAAGGPVAAGAGQK